MYINVYHPFTALYNYDVLHDTFVPFLSSLRRNSFLFLLTTHHIPLNFVHRVKKRKRGQQHHEDRKEDLYFSTQLFPQLKSSSLFRIPLSLSISHCLLWFPFPLFRLQLKIFIFDYVRPFLMEKR